MLLTRVLEVLSPEEGETLLDCTAGAGGHAAAIGQRLGASGCVVLNDADRSNLTMAESVVRATARSPRVVGLQGNFAEAPRKMAEAGLQADMLLADLGFSSMQVDEAQRGFSFQREGPLDMRYDSGTGESAAQLLARCSEQELIEILRDFGEEPGARRIARAVLAAREDSPITTTGRLASIIRETLGRPSGRTRIDPATRTFQALRIAVNDELGSLDALLEAIGRVASGAMIRSGGSAWLARDARVAIISFHSLEDRLVKNSFGGLVKRGLADWLARKPVVASDEEVSANPRARSAKLRSIRLRA